MCRVGPFLKSQITKHTRYTPPSPSIYLSTQPLLLLFPTGVLLHSSHQHQPHSHVLMMSHFYHCLVSAIGSWLLTEQCTLSPSAVALYCEKWWQKLMIIKTSPVSRPLIAFQHCIKSGLLMGINQSIIQGFLKVTKSCNVAISQRYCILVNVDITFLF